MMSKDLKTLIAASQERFQAEPGKAQTSFTVQSRLLDGLRCEAETRGHVLHADEPQALGGADTAANPVEMLLAALGTCQEITYRAFASVMEVPLDEVRVELKGDIDLRGFFAVSEDVRPGFQNIRVVTHLKSSASEETLRTLVAAVEKHCPVMDMLSNPVPISTSVKFET